MTPGAKDGRVATMPKRSWKQAYRLDQTGIVIGPELRLLKTSDELGWADLNVSVVDPEPHEFIENRAIPDLWLAMPLDQIDVAVLSGGREQHMIIPAGQPGVIAPGTSWGVRLQRSSYVLHVHLKRHILTEVANELFERDVKSVEVLLKFAVEDQSMTWLLRSLKEALYEPVGHADLKVGHIARALAADVLRKHIASPREAPVAQYRPLAAAQAKLVADYVREHLSSKISLKDLTALTGISQTVFLPRFRASFGLSPYRYVLETRVHRARQFLEKPNVPIAEIAMLCGFADQAHFTVTFKRIVGMTPTQYRRVIS